MNSLARVSDIKPEDLVDIPMPTDVQISPTKKNVVYTLEPGNKTGEHKTSSLWLAEVGKEHSARQITSGQFLDRKPQWSRDGDSIAFLSDRAKAGKSCAIYVLSLSGGEAYSITPTENEKAISSFKWSPNGQFIAYLSADEKTPERKKREEVKDDAKVYGEDWEYARLRLLHVQTRQVSVVAEGDYHITSLAWSPDSKEIGFIKTKTSQLDSALYFGVDIESVSLRSKELKHISHFPSRASGLIWTRDLPGNQHGGDVLYFLAGHSPTGSGCTSSCVYQLLLSDGRWQKTTGKTSGDGCCVDGSNGLVLFQEQNAPTVFIKLQYGLTDTVSTLYGDYTYPRDNEIRAWDAALVEDSTQMRIHAAYATVESSANNPPELYFHSTAGTTTQLSNHSPTIRALSVSTGERFECKASDGKLIESALFKPVDATGPLPTVVLPHGGPYWRSPLSFAPDPWFWAHYLLSAGYCILCPNYRGSAGRGEVFAAYSAGNMGKKDYTDITDSVNAAVEEGIVDKERVLVGGWSQGGFLSYLCAVRGDIKWKGAICGAGVTDWDMLAMSSDMPFFEAALAGTAPWACKDKSNVEGRYGSAVWEMASMKPEDRTPVLILHGEADERVPLSQAVAFHRGCLEMGWPCEFVVYPREPHVFEERGHHLDMLRRVRRFVDSHLR
jgi:dipeptidyl aminopeptidase/acylaminoacyl peptidase